MKYELNQRARSAPRAGGRGGRRLSHPGKFGAGRADLRFRHSRGRRARRGTGAGRNLHGRFGLGVDSSGRRGRLEWPHVFVTTDHPMAACLYSQYAGWQISTDGFFAMGSGPMRAVYAREDLFLEFDYREEPSEVVGVLEGRKLPNAAVVQYICERTGITSDKLNPVDRPDGQPGGECASRRALGRNGPAQTLGTGLRRAANPKCLRQYSPAAGRRERHGGNRPHERRHFVRCTGDAVGARPGRRDRRNRPSVPACSSAAFGKPFLQDLRGSRPRLLQDRQESVQPG